MKSKIKKGIACVLLVFVGLILICFLPPAFNYFSKSFLLSFASGDSMYPTIGDGDLIVSRLYVPGKIELQKGMIVGFWDEYEKGETISVQHRIVEITEEGIETQGDNNGTIDEGIKKYSQIRSVYCFKIPFCYLRTGGLFSLLLSFSDGLKQEIFSFPVFSYLIFFSWYGWIFG